MSFPDHIFKSYDIRGKVGTELNEELVNNVGKAFADWLPNEGTIAVGYDMRPDSQAFAKAIIEGITTQGYDVWDVGMITTDMIYYAVGANDLVGGVMITASHNPGEYNGIKLCREEARPVGENSGLFEIRDKVKNKDFKASNETGVVSNKDVSEGWIQHVLSFVDTNKLKPLKIAVDAGNGTAGVVFAELEPYVPWEVKEMYFEPDGTFPNHEANPLKFETLKDLMAKIKKENLDGGVAFDGDGDRAFLVDEEGEVLTAGILQALISDYLLKTNPGAKIIYEVRSSKTVEEVIKENGGNPVMTKAGHSNIKQSMRELDSPFGSEASGHFFFRDNWYADSGLVAAVIGLYVAGLTGNKLSDIRRQYTRYEAIPETNFAVEDKQAAMDNIANSFPEAKQNWLDGIRLDFNDGSWLNARPSNTEPLLRLNAEAKSKNRLDSLVSRAVKVIK